MTEQFVLSLANLLYLGVGLALLAAVGYLVERFYQRRKAAQAADRRKRRS